MHRFAIPLFCLAAILASAASAFAQPPSSDPLAPALDRWEKVSAEFDARLAAARDRYADRLEIIYARHRELGDLDAVMVVRGERARLKEHGLPTAADRVDHPPELAALQDLVLKQHARWRTDRDKALAGCVQEKFRVLTARQKELTREDKIEEALAVRRQLESLKNHSEFGPLLPSANANEPPGVAAATPEVAASPLPIPTRVYVWAMEEGRGTMSLPGEGIHALHLESVKWTEGRSGGALLLDGAASRILLKQADWDSLAEAKSHTLAAWVNAADFRRVQPVFSRQTETRKGWAMTISTDGNVLLEVRGGGEKLRLVSKDVLSTETWHHLAMALDFSEGKTRAKIYVDGLLSASGEAPWMPEQNNLPLLIGAYRWSASYDLHFDGRFDNVVISSPAVSADELKSLAK